MNLLSETLEDIKGSGHAPEDISFIGSKDGNYQCTWDEYKAISNIDYDAESREQEVASDLIIIFSDVIMSRHEYDGSECWYFQPVFVAKENPKKIGSLCGGMWDTVKGLNGGSE